MAKAKWFKPEPLSTLLADTEATVKWRLDSYIPDGASTLLAAYAKLGKSTFSTLLALAIARGESFLGQVTAQCPVLWLSEEPRPLVRQRFEEFGALPSDPVTFHYYQGEPASALLEVEPFINAHKVGFVVIDTALTFLDIIDENENAPVARALKTITSLIRRTGAAVLILHHTGKEATGSVRDIRGASAFLGYVDQALLLRGVTTETRRRLSSHGRYAQGPELVYELVEVERDGRKAKSLHMVTPKDRQADIVLAVLTMEPQGIKQITEAAEVKEAPCRAALQTLMMSGAVIREGAGAKGKPHTWRRARSLDEELTALPANSGEDSF